MTYPNTNSLQFSQQANNNTNNIAVADGSTTLIEEGFTADMFENESAIQIGALDPFDETRSKIAQNKGINLSRLEIITNNEFIPLGQDDLTSLINQAQLSVTFGGENNFSVTNAYRLMELNYILQNVIADSMSRLLTVDAAFGDPKLSNQHIQSLAQPIKKVYEIIDNLTYEPSFKNIKNLNAIVTDVKEALSIESGIAAQNSND